MITFRRVRQTDLEAVFLLGQSVKYSPNNNSDGFLLLPPSRKELETWLTELKHFYVADKGQKVIGYLTCFDLPQITQYKHLVTLLKNFCKDGPLLYIDNIVISENERGKGLGTKFFTFLIKTAKDEGYSYLVTTIALLPKRNNRSIAFHKKLGFNEVGTDTLETSNLFNIMIKKL